MNKTEYFELIKEITTAVTHNGFSYARIFSEARPSMNGYKTKIWSVYGKAGSAANFINKKFGDRVTATDYSSSNKYASNNNVLIIPNERVEYNTKEVLKAAKKLGPIDPYAKYGTKAYKKYEAFKKDLGITTIEARYILK